MVLKNIVGIGLAPVRFENIQVDRKDRPYKKKHMDSLFCP